MKSLNINCVRFARYFTLPPLLVLWLTSYCFAQDITTNASVDTNNILIGDWIKLTLEAKYPGNVKITWPAIPDTLPGFDKVEIKKPVTQTSDQNKITKQELIMTAFDSGIYQLPAFEFQYLKQGNPQPFSILTNPINIYVASVPVDTSQAIKDIKLPLEKKMTLAEMLPYIIGGIIIVLAFILLYYYFKRRKKNILPVLTVEPKFPPHRIAIQALRELEESKIWQQGKTKEYYTRLTDILRIYIEQQFRINAMELTTDEIMDKLAFSNINKELQDALEKIMRLSDLVKFAKKLTLPGDNESCMEIAYRFVKHTIPKETLIKEEVTV